MFPDRTQLQTPHDETTLFKACAVLPAFVLSFQYTIQPDRTIGGKEIRQQTLGVLCSGCLGLSTPDYDYLNPYPVTVGVEPTSPWKGMNRQRMNVSA